MTFEYIPKGVCSRKMIIDVENGKVEGLQVIGGCNGNLQGIAHLVQGMPVDEAIEQYFHTLIYGNTVTLGVRLKLQ